jgi:hypothetical protein
MTRVRLKVISRHQNEGKPSSAISDEGSRRCGASLCLSGWVRGVHQNHEDEKNSSEFFEADLMGRRTLQVLLQPAIPFGNHSLPRERQSFLNDFYRAGFLIDRTGK